jgi:hypothetical protein
MTRQEFDRRFAATPSNTEGFSDEQLARLNDAVFAQVSDLDIDGEFTDSHVKNVSDRAFNTIVVPEITTTKTLRFRDLARGEAFSFSPGVWSFSDVCRKTGPRTYVRAADPGKLGIRVGSVNVGVRREPAHDAERLKRARPDFGPMIID